MRFSGLVFPLPNPPTYSHDRLVGEILYVPHDFADCPDKYVKPKEDEKIMNSAAKRSESKRNAGLTLDIDAINEDFDGNRTFKDIGNYNSDLPLE